MTKLLAFMSLLMPAIIHCLDNGLARTPPMGWLSWERFRCNTDCKNDGYNCISESLLKSIADHLVDGGFLAAGYEYLNVDDCWQAPSRDQNGRLVADPERFPSGMKALVDYVHKKGLKFGIYEDFGTKTCGGFPGSEFYMKTDADTFAEWGVDLVKFDGCNSSPEQFDEGYPAMGLFLNQTKRPILYSCEWPFYQIMSGMKPDYTAIKKTCNIARNYKSVQDSWESVKGIIEMYANDTYNASQYAGPGFWNDPDQLIIGDYGLSFAQERTQMVMWAMFSAPLFISADVRYMRDESRALLQNPLIIGVNQDPLGIQATRKFVQSDPAGNIEIWMKPIMPKGSWAVALISTRTDGRNLRTPIKLVDIGLTDSRGYNVTEATYYVQMGIFSPHDFFDLYADPTGAVMVIAKVLP